MTVQSIIFEDCSTPLTRGLTTKEGRPILTKENRNDRLEQDDHSNGKNVRFLTDEEIIDAIARDPAFTSISAWTPREDTDRP